MDFQKLADVLEELEKTASGNAMREILAEFFKKVPAEDIAVVSYLTLGRIASDYDDVVLGLADKSVLKSIAVAGGIEMSKVDKLMQEKGDAGLVAEKALENKPRTLVPLGKLTLQELFDKLHKIASISGTGAQEQKSNILVSMLQKVSPKGAKYVIRILLGTLRIGAGDMTVLDALAIAYTGDKKNKEILEAAYNICPDVGIIAETLARKGLKGIEKIDIHVGRPIKMMLCQRVEEIEEIPEKIPGEFAVEAKYDGERMQAHKDHNGKITLFSRRLENITAQFPDLVKEIERQVAGKEFVIEGEIIAVDEKGHHLPFQTLMQRRRKYDIEKYMKDIPVLVKVFDVLYWNEKSQIHGPYKIRTQLLTKIVTKSKHVMLADKIVTDDISEMDEFFHDMLKEKYEGVIVKSLTGEYQAGTRGWNWIKWKKDYVKDMSDTLDLVIVGAYHGKGKRSGVYGALLCAAYNEKEDVFETVCKLGTGLTDEVLAELPKKLAKYRLNHTPARLKVKKEMEPEVWFEPKIVVEVMGAELTKSPFHTCGSGLALRFPRFLQLRENKKAEQATTSTEIEQMAKK
ncbi:ATP-dependent DNA ligase [Candidatus Woesearchaeota archaeon]|nr:ATP-dependent DNA ligase [Candidatus Woesearchaeota archaeon]